MHQMSQEDLALFRQAEALANQHQTLAAYRLFCLIESHGNTDLEVRFWILQTTPSLHEARSLLTFLEQQAPHHPALPRAREYVATHWRSIYVMPVPVALGPILPCPYCGHTGPTVLEKEVSPIGWLVFGAGLVLGFFGLLFVICLGVLLIALSFLGLLISERRCNCARCSARLATM